MSGKINKPVLLEGKGRLPTAVQDVILEFGSAISNLQNITHKGGNGAESLGSAIKQFAALDAIVDNSAQNLERLSKTTNDTLKQTQHIVESIAQISEVQDRFQCMEREHYYSTTFSNNSGGS